jgi:alanine racemase
MGRTAVAILSTENLRHNVQVLKNKVGTSKIIAMVKANAYGHGIRSVALRLDGIVDMLGVASIDEALALRKVGVRSPILLAEGVFEPDEFITASAEGFHVVFHTIEQVDWLEKSTCSNPLLSWIKVNTGMGRLGFPLEHAKRIYERFCENPQVAKPIQILSHFACADEAHHPLNQDQLYKFKTFIQETQGPNEDLGFLMRSKCSCTSVHSALFAVMKSQLFIRNEYSICNSAGIFHFPDHHYDYVRPGIALYGVSPIGEKKAEDLGLKPVMTVQSSLISVQRVPKGTRVGYGARYECPEDMPIGVVAFGYGDGYPITAKDGTPILVKNVACSLIGRVSMDMLTVDLRSCPGAKVGDPVTLWGEGLPVERVAQHTSSLTYDILTGVQHRVKFTWI